MRERVETVGKVVVTRGGRVESVHRVHVAVVDADGRPVVVAGDPHRRVFLRSAAKPFQANPRVADGAVEALGIPREELALACASHSGTGEHTAGVRSLLERLGREEEALACGPHAPLGRRAAWELARSGGAPGRIHNNCSGKHAGMLALALHRGWSPRGYESPGHPVQRRVLEEVSRWCEVEPSRIGRGIDGCGVPCFAVPLAVAARGLARFGRAADAGEAGPRAIVEVMAGHPTRVAGAGRLDTELMARAGDRVVSKVGAEGVHVAVVRGQGLAVAIKAEDGAGRASGAALVEVLAHLKVLAPAAEEALRGAFVGPVVNTRGERVGRLRVELGLRGGGRRSGPVGRSGAARPPESSA